MNKKAKSGSSAPLRLRRVRRTREFVGEAVPVASPSVLLRPTVPSDPTQLFIDAYPSPVALLDKSRTITKVNRAWSEFFYGTNIDLQDGGIGAKYPDLFERTTVLSDSLRVLREGVRRVISGDKGEHKAVLRFGLFDEPLALFVNLAPLDDATNGDAVVMVSHDRLSSVKVASEVLRSNDEFLHHYFQSANVLQWQANGPDRSFTRVGDHAEKLLGFPAADWLADGFWRSHIHPDDRRDVARAYAAAVKGGGDTDQLRYRMISKDGEIVWIHDMFMASRNALGVQRCAGLMVDVTDQKRSEQALQLLTGRLISAQEEERKRIARELHDDLNQRIAVISIELEQLANTDPSLQKAVQDRIKRIQKHVEDIGTDIHVMSHQLHPSKLDHLGLVPAIKSLCHESSTGRGFEIGFFQDGVPVRLPKDLKLCMFRVAQEALQNSARHSGASKIDVELSLSGGSLKLVVSDDGRGFNASPKTTRNGLGLTSMEERLRSINGELRIISKPGSGTVIEAIAPVSRVVSYDS